MPCWRSALLVSLHHPDLNWRWHPSTYTLGERTEIAVPEKATLKEFEDLLADHSGLTNFDLEVLHCNMYSGLDFLDVPNEKWENLGKKEPIKTYSSYSYSYSVGSYPWHCKDGQLFLIKSKTEIEKKLTAEAS